VGPSWQHVYDIGGNYYALTDLFHGILLAPLPLPSIPFNAIARLVLPVSKIGPGDPRYDCRIELPEPFLLFCLCAGSMSSGRFTVYRPATLFEQIKAEATNFIRRTVEFAPEHRRVTLPGVLQWHRASFGTTWRDMLGYLCTRLPDTELAHYLQSLLNLVRGAPLSLSPRPHAPPLRTHVS